MSQTVARVLLVRFGSIGNALVAVPAIRALSRAWPQARLSLLADPMTRELFQGCPYLDEIILYDWKGAHRFGHGYFRLVAELRRRKFTHSIHFRRYLRSELLGLFSGARERVGFKTGSRWQWLTRPVPYGEGESVIEQNLNLVRALEIEARDLRLECWPTDSAAVGRVFGQLGNGLGPVVVLHPAGATQREHLWPHYGMLAQRLMQERQAKVIMIGALAEAAEVERQAVAAAGPVGRAVGLPIREVAELIRRADLFVGTDSGPAHLADAVGTPGVILYAPHRGLQAQIRKWKPEGEHFLALLPRLDCAECGEHPCPRPRQQECAASIPLEEALAAAEKLLAETKTPRRGSK